MGTPVRVEHERKDLRMFLRHLTPGTDVAVEQHENSRANSPVVILVAKW